MLVLPGYRIQQILYESKHTLVFRARRERDEKPVVLKTLKKMNAPQAEFLRIRRERDVLTKAVGLEGVIGLLGFEEAPEADVLILDDFQGISLNKAMMDPGLSPAEILEVGDRLTEVLRRLHEKGILHKALHPGNILVIPQTREVRLIDFAAASTLPREYPQLGHPESLEGHLPCMSPEQTGRMNRWVDYRSDYYGLGATLYELFARRPVFPAVDPWELMHCHLAVQPTPLHEFSNEIPRPISDLIAKLLAKTAEKRYQSAQGIQEDIRQCRLQMEREGRVSAFLLGQKDEYPRLNISQKLYGRSREIEQIHSTFERVLKGHKEIMLVSGASGYGKTTLIQEVYKPLTRQKGYFVSGRFDTLQRNKPYSALLQALQGLATQLTSEPAEQQRRWQERIVGALGANAGIVLTLLPEFRSLIGPQPSVPDLPAPERTNRFHLVFEQFIGVFARPEHPMILFLDDLQWADAASLGLISSLLSTTQSSLFVIGAFRDEEVKGNHPLWRALEKLQESQCLIHRLELAPLMLNEVNQLVSESFGCSQEATLELADTLLSQTKGSPLLLKELLLHLVELGVVRFQPESRRWEWDLAEVRRRGPSASPLQLFAEKMSKLTPATVALLQRAACLGPQVDLEVLSICEKRPVAEILENLIPACEAGWLHPLGEAYRAIGLSEAPPRFPPAHFRFAHDQLRQVVYATIPEQERWRMHLNIGRCLSERIQDDPEALGIFDEVNHLNAAREGLGDQSTRDALAQSNREAGLRAKNLAAHEPAFLYFTTGIELLGPERWSRLYALSLSLHEEAAESAWLRADYQKAWELTKDILDHGQYSLDKVRAYRIRIEAQTAQYTPKDAVLTGLACLLQLRLRLSPQPSQLAIYKEMLSTRLQLLGRRIETLIDLPLMTDPRLLAAITIMRSMSVPTFVSNTRLMILMLFIQVRLVARYGHPRHSCSIFASYAMALCGSLGDISTAFRVAKLAIRLVEKFQVKELKCRVMFMTNTFVIPWKEHLRTTLKPLQEGHQSGLENGDLEYAALCKHMYCHHAFFLGKELSALERDFTLHNEDIQRLGQRIPLDYNHIFHQATLNLLGRTADPCLLAGEIFDERKELPRFQESQDRVAVMCILLLKLELCYLFGRYRDAVQAGDLLESYRESGQSFIGVSRMVAYDSLARLKIWDEVSGTEQRRILVRVQANQKKLKRWTHHAPMNHLHLYDLVEAERHRVQERHEQAAEYFDRAIALAKKHEFLIEEALAFELAGEHQLIQGKGSVAKAYLLDARNRYAKWGATAKVQQLDHRHAEQMGRQRRVEEAYPSTTMSMATATITGREPNQNLLSLLQASQSISGELEPPKLLDKILRVVMENAGAEKGFIVYRREQGLEVEAYLSGTQTETSTTPVPLDRCPHLSPAIVRYVFRTRQNVVLADAANEGQFIHDPYVTERKPKSILCMAILRFGELSAILYLENNQAADAFSPERVNMARMLSAQISISMENAKKHEKLGKALVEAKESERIKSEFLARTSRKLRSPLNSIINMPFASLQQFESREYLYCIHCRSLFELEPGERVDEQAPCGFCHATGGLRLENHQHFNGDHDELYRNLQTVIKSGNALLSAVNDVLDMSKLEAGHVQLKPEMVKVSEVLIDALNTVDEAASQRRVTFSVPEISSEITLEADKLRLKQILIHLLDNAVKFSREGEAVEVGVKQTDKTLLLSVVDHGMGITKEHQGQIFERFYASDSKSNPQALGTGIGLTITKALVELHGGKIWVESEVGKGSTFFVELPRMSKIPL